MDARTTGPAPPAPWQYRLLGRLSRLLSRSSRYHRLSGRPAVKTPKATGQAELLVYGECRCGWRMAAPEGSRWPLCPNCGRQVWPTGFGSGGSAPGDHGDRLGYVARLFPEATAVAILASDRDQGDPL